MLLLLYKIIQSGILPFFSFFLLGQKEPKIQDKTNRLRAFCPAFAHLSADLANGSEKSKKERLFLKKKDCF
jgi:hypothetical protein